MHQVSVKYNAPGVSSEPCYEGADAKASAELSDKLAHIKPSSLTIAHCTGLNYWKSIQQARQPS